MENLSTQVDLYLTEISIELLGNKIYNLNGERKHRLTDLFKALPEEKDESQDQSNDLLCSMEYDENFTEDEQSLENYLEDQMAYTLVDANSSPEVNQSLIRYLKQYKTNQDKLVKDMSEVHVKKIVERNRILANMNKARTTAASTETLVNRNITEKITTYYENERDQLLKSCLNIQRLIKYVINDTEDDVERGELIGFVHAIGTIRECESKKEKNRKIVKPYKKL